MLFRQIRTITTIPPAQKSRLIFEESLGLATAVIKDLAAVDWLSGEVPSHGVTEDGRCHFPLTTISLRYQEHAFSEP